MIEGLTVRIKATTMSAMPLHRMRVADMTVLVRGMAACDKPPSTTLEHSYHEDTKW